MSEQTTPRRCPDCGGPSRPGWWHTVDCPCGATPRTVEEAAREEAERRWPMTDQEREMVSFGVRYAQQATRVPSVAQVAEVLARHVVRYSPLTEQDTCLTCGDLTPRLSARPDAIEARSRAHQAEQVLLIVLQGPAWIERKKD